MNVLYVPGDVQGSGYYRCFQPGKLLAANGHDVGMPELSEKEGRLHFDGVPTDADVYVFAQQRGDKDIGRFFAEARTAGRAVIVDSDDYLISPPAWSDVARFAQRGGFQPIFKSMAAADRVTVSTEFLAEAYRRYQRDIVVLPNYLDWTMWENVGQQSEVDRGGRVRVGYMGNAGWHRGDLAILNGLLGPFLERNPHVDFVIAGDSSGEALIHLGLGIEVDGKVRLSIDPARVFSVPAVDYRSGRLPEITATFDVGLVPLADHPFNEGKSHLKGLEYAACGIPSVVSPTGSYQDAVEDGMRAFLARRPNDWIRSLELLVNDDDLRRDLGRKNRAYAAENTIQQHWPRWQAAYADLLGDDTHEVARQAIRLGAIQKHRELRPLVEMVERLEPRVVVEIGSATGGTFYAWCQAAAPDALLVSIDLPGGDFGGSELDKVAETGADTYGVRDYDRIKGHGRQFQTVELIRADSQKPETRAALETLLDGRPIDFLMIDGDHAYQGVRSDFELYAPLVRDGGLVAFHDIVHHVHHPLAQVDRLWREIRPQHRNTELVDGLGGPWGGIGVIHWERSEAMAA